jgi:hypothetical protein
MGAAAFAGATVVVSPPAGFATATGVENASAGRFGRRCLLDFFDMMITSNNFVPCLNES